MIWTLCKKEIRSYFDHPMAYILIVVFLAVNSYFYFRTAFVQEISTLRPMFEVLPWIWLFFVPAISMRSIAEERKAKTLDFLFSQPIKTWQIIFAKWLSAVFFLSVALLLTLPIPLLLSRAGSFDWGAVFAEYFASFFFLGALVSVGLFASALTKNQVVAFIVGFIISFFFIISGFELVMLSLTGFTRSLFGQISLLTHFENMIRGVFDTRDVIYFVSFSVLFLGISYLFLVRERLNRNTRYFWRLRIGIFLMIAASVAINLFGNAIPGRVDFTSNKIYTISSGTKEILGALDDIVTAKIYISKNLPTELELRLRDIKDILRDFEKSSSGNFHYEFIVLTGENKDLEDALSLGIAQNRFNILKDQEVTLQTGYFGLSVLYAGEHQTIPFISTTSNLEYELISFIHQLTVKEKPKIGFLAGHGEKTLEKDFTTFAEELSKQYELGEIVFDPKKPVLDKDVAVLVIAGPTSNYSDEERQFLLSFAKNGGKLFLLVDTITIDQQTMAVSKTTQNIGTFLEEYGVTINSNIVFDLNSHESVSVSNNDNQYVIPYPFWLKAFGDEQHPVTNGIQSLFLPWASSIEISKDKTNPSVELLALVKTTGSGGGSQDKDFNISIDQDLKNLQGYIFERTLALAVSEKSDGKDERKSEIRTVLVGDSDFLSDAIASQVNSNLVFGLNVVDWLVQDTRLASIRAKDRTIPPLIFETDKEGSMIRSLNLIGIPFLVVLYGFLRILARRKRTRRQKV